MKTIRKNASLAQVAEDAAQLVLILQNRWRESLRYADSARCPSNEKFDARSRADALFQHMSDIEQLALHLNRFSTKS